MATIICKCGSTKYGVVHLCSEAALKKLEPMRLYYTEVSLFQGIGSTVYRGVLVLREEGGGGG